MVESTTVIDVVKVPATMSMPRVPPMDDESSGRTDDRHLGCDPGKTGIDQDGSWPRGEYNGIIIRSPKTIATAEFGVVVGVLHSFP